MVTHSKEMHNQRCVEGSDLEGATRRQQAIDGIADEFNGARQARGQTVAGPVDARQDRTRLREPVAAATGHSTTAVHPDKE